MIEARRSLRRAFRRAALSGVALLVALLAVEVAVRIVAPEQAPIRLAQLGSALANDPRTQFMDLIEPDPELFWRLAPSVRLEQDRHPFFGLVSNSQGLREEGEIAATKAAGEQRVLCLGDSCTFGYLLRAEESFVQALERRLRAQFPATPIECINAGVPGFTLFQGWRFLETRAAPLQPDLVVLNFGWNESVSWDGTSDFESHRRLQARRPPNWLAGSAIARRLWSLRGGEAPPEGQRPRLTPDEFSELLERCRASAQALGAELIVLVGGARFNVPTAGPKRVINEYQKRQYDFGSALRLSDGGAPGVVDGVAVALQLARSLPIEQLFLDQTHPSARLNEAVGEALAARVAPWLRARGAK
ncbi:MAG: hypothetical protein JNL90_11125 [Planctomycetes bacterium]|nr:hypothetical protein [Planctomycetota bacterium]